MVSYNCESLLSADRLRQLLMMFNVSGAGIVFLQGTCLDGEGYWWMRSWEVFSSGRVDKASHAGVLTAIDHEQIPGIRVCFNYAWQHGRVLTTRFKSADETQNCTIDTHILNSLLLSD